MSYYQGDYFAGDPGFFSFLGGLAKKAAGFLPGPAGQIAGGLLRGTERKVLTGTVAAAGRASERSMMRRVATRGIGIVRRHPVLTAAGAAGAVGAAAGMGAERLMMGRGGRRHRRMNVTNPKALRRAIRRTHGFAKLAMRTIHLVHPKKKVRFGGFRKTRRKAAA